MASETTVTAAQSVNLSVLTGKTIAFLVASGFAEAEFSGLQRALAKIGARSMTIAPENGLVNSWTETVKTNPDGSTVTMGDWGHYHPVDQQLGETLAADLDAVIVPSGARSLTKLQSSLHTARIVNHAIDAEKPVLLFKTARELVTSRETLPASALTINDLNDEAWIDTAIAHLATAAQAYDTHDSRAAA